MPTNDDIRAILGDLSTAQRALRESNAAFVETISGFRRLLDSMEAASDAQGRAMDAVIAATNKALAVYDGRHQ